MELERLTTGYIQRGILIELQNAYPEAVTIERLVTRLYGYGKGPDDPEAVIRHTVWRLKRVLKPYGWSIVTGYRLVRDNETMPRKVTRLLQRLADGMTVPQASRDMNVPENTLNKWLTTARKNANVTTTTQLVAAAIRKGWIR